MAVLTRMLGPLFNGWKMSDGYWAYRDLDNRLSCLAHVQRKDSLTAESAPLASLEVESLRCNPE